MKPTKVWNIRNWWRSLSPKSKRRGGGGWGGTVHIEENTKEVDQMSFYVGSVFDNEKEAYSSYKSYALPKGFETRKNMTTKSTTDQKVIRRRLFIAKRFMRS